MDEINTDHIKYPQASFRLVVPDKVLSGGGLIYKEVLEYRAVINYFNENMPSLIARFREHQEAKDHLKKQIFSDDDALIDTEESFVSVVVLQNPYYDEIPQKTRFSLEFEGIHYQKTNNERIVEWDPEWLLHSNNKYNIN